MSTAAINNPDDVPTFSAAGSTPTAPQVTPSQEAIITAAPTHNTILSVKAGPGSGKTFTLTRRIAHLINNHDVQPNEILVLAMANRSVNSLKDSLKRSVGDELAAQVDVSTFHSFCSKTIDNYGSQFLPAFKRKKLIDDQGWKDAMTIFLAKTLKFNGEHIGGNLTPNQLDRLIFELRSQKLSMKEAAEKHKFNAAYLKMLMEYLDSHGIMRFNDLVIHTSTIMNKSKKLAASDKEALIEQFYNYKVVIVDEFQDMHDDLLSIIKDVVKYPTAGRNKNTIKHLTIAGDPNQSIYDFLGSNPALMNNLHEAFPSVQIHHKVIEESFRCTPEVLKASIDLCLQRDDLTSQLRSTRDSGHPPVIKKFNSQAEECSFIVEEIIRLICEAGGLLKPCDFAILSRTNKEVEYINNMLINNYGIKFNKLSSSVSWPKSKLHMLLDVLNIIEKGPGSELAWLCLLLKLDTSRGGKARVANVFNLTRRWAVNAETSDDIMEQWIAKFSSYQVDKRYSINLVYKTPSQRVFIDDIKVMYDLIVRERVILQKNLYNQTPLMLLESLGNIVENALIKKALNDVSGLVTTATSNHQDSTTLAQRYKKSLSENLRAFYKSMLVSYNRYREEEKAGHDSFLSFFLRTYNDDIPAYAIDAVNTSTIHAAKGLEFPVVFILNSALPYMPSSWEKIIEGTAQLPSSNSRLLYVATTRAKDLLYLSTGKSISDVGETVMEDFTTQLPQFNKPILSQLSSSLQRRIPTSEQITEGAELLKLFHSMNTTQRRNLHYVSKKYTLVTPMKLYKHLYIRKMVRGCSSILL